MPEKIFTQNKWIGGLADSAFVGGEGSIAEGVGLDIRSEPGVLKVSQALTKESSGTVTGFCDVALLASDGYAYFGERLTGKIYKRKPNGTWVNVSTLLGASCTAIAEWNNKLWFISSGTISSIALSDAASNDNWINPPSPGVFGTLNIGTFHPTVVQGAYLIIGNGTNLATIDDGEKFTKNGTPEITLPDFPVNSEIRTLSKFGIDVIVGVSSKGQNPKAEVWRWDLFSPTYITSAKVEELGINAFIPVENNMLVQAGNRGKIYYYDGEKLHPKLQIPGNYENAQITVDPGSVTSFEGITCFGVSNLSNNPTPQGVYTFGRRDIDYPNALMLEFVPSINRTGTMRIGALLAKGTALLVGWQSTDLGTQGVDIIDYNNKYSSAYFKTRAIVGNRRAKKTFSEYTISYKSLPPGTNISLHYDANFSNTFSGTITLNNQKNYNKMFSRQKFEAGVSQFKIDLTASGNKAPEIEEFTVQWNEQETL